MKPEYTFDFRKFLLGLAFLTGATLLAYYQYQQWFNPESVGGFSVRRASVMGIILTFFLILVGFYLIFISFKGGTETITIFLPKEKWENLKKATQTLDWKDFEKLLEGEIDSEPQEEYAALTVDYFKNQPGVATIQISREVLSAGGSYYESKDLGKVIPVEGTIVTVLEKIKAKYKNPAEAKMM